VEGLLQGENLHPIQQAFIDNDAQQCGFCTPGFVVACTALVNSHASPSAEQIRLGLGGNLCRCGTYAGIQGAIVEAGRGNANGQGGAP
jgi:aerobic-type carbon monoxide dehydrogenase small subunit (CoxS/CutS family)